MTDQGLTQFLERRNQRIQSQEKRRAYSIIAQAQHQAMMIIREAEDQAEKLDKKAQRQAWKRIRDSRREAKRIIREAAEASADTKQLYERAESDAYDIRVVAVMKAEQEYNKIREKARLEGLALADQDIKDRRHLRLVDARHEHHLADNRRMNHG